MSEMVVQANQFLTKSLDVRCFEICHDFDGKEEILPEHHGVSVIKECSGLICLACMKFFHDETLAQEHTRNLMHYNKCCEFLDMMSRRWQQTEPLYSEEDKLRSTEWFAEDIKSYEVCYPGEESCVMKVNEELLTIKEKTGVVCFPCMKFFPNEDFAEEHVRSFAHYKKYYDWVQNKEMEEPCVEHSFNREEHLCKEREPEQISRDIPCCDKNKTNMTSQVYKNCNDTDRPVSGSSESSESSLEASFEDNDFWLEIDEKLGHLLEDINMECGE